MRYKLIGTFEPQSGAELEEAKHDYELLQSVIISLEAYKRTIGRRLSRTDKCANASEYFEIAMAYNNVENQIAFICDKFGIERASLPHKIKLEDLR